MQIVAFDSPQANPPVSPAPVSTTPQTSTERGQSVVNDPFLASPTSNRLRPNFFASGLSLSAVAQAPAYTVRSAGSEHRLKAIQAALASTNATPGHRENPSVAISPGQEGNPIFIPDTPTPGRQANPIIIPVTPTPFRAPRSGKNLSVVSPSTVPVPVMEHLVRFFRSVETQTDIVYPAPLPPPALPVFTALSPRIYPSLPADAGARSMGDLLTPSRRRVDIVDDDGDLNKMPGYLPSPGSFASPSLEDWVTSTPQQTCLLDGHSPPRKRFQVLDDGDSEYEKFRSYPSSGVNVSSTYRCDTPGLGFLLSTPTRQLPSASGSASSQSPTTSDDEYADSNFDFDDPEVVQAICQAMDEWN